VKAPSFVVPSKLPSLFSGADEFYRPTVHDVVLYFSFSSFLPGLDDIFRISVLISASSAPVLDEGYCYISLDIAWSVGLSVCVSVTTENPTKTHRSH